MLVITRKLNEKIRIGDDVVIHICRLSGGSVRVGIEAPRELRILRDELTEREQTADTVSLCVAGPQQNGGPIHES